MPHLRRHVPCGTTCRQTAAVRPAGHRCCCTPSLCCTPVLSCLASFPALAGSPFSRSATRPHCRTPSPAAPQRLGSLPRHRHPPAAHQTNHSQLTPSEGAVPDCQPTPTPPHPTHTRLPHSALSTPPFGQGISHCLLWRLHLTHTHHNQAPAAPLVGCRATAMFLQVQGDAAVRAMLGGANQRGIPPWSVDPRKKLGFEKQLGNLKKTMGWTYKVGAGLPGYRLRAGGPQGRVLDLERTAQEQGLSAQDIIFIEKLPEPVKQAAPLPPQAAPVQQMPQPVPQQQMMPQPQPQLYEAPPFVDRQPEMPVRVSGLEGLSAEKLQRLNHFAAILNTLDDDTVRRILSGDQHAECPTCGRGGPEEHHHHHHHPRQRSAPQQPESHTSAKRLDDLQKELSAMQSGPSRQGEAGRPGGRLPDYRGSDDGGSSAGSYVSGAVAGPRHHHYPRPSRSRRGHRGPSSDPLDYPSTADTSANFWKYFVEEWGKQTYTLGTGALVNRVTESELDSIARTLSANPNLVSLQRPRHDMQHREVADEAFGEVLSSVFDEERASMYL